MEMDPIYILKSAPLKLYCHYYKKQDSPHHPLLDREVRISSKISMMKSSVFCALAGLAMVGLCQPLAPENDIVFSSSKTSSIPLQYAGGNAPYFAGKSLIITNLHVYWSVT